MRIFRNFFIITFLLLATCSYSEEKLVFGSTILDYSIPDQNRIKILRSNLVTKMREYYKKDIDIVFFEDRKSLLEDFKERKTINAIVVSANSYFENKELLKKISINPFIYRHGSVNNSQLLLISNKNSKINSINDIKNKVFINTRYMQNYTLWLDYLSLKKLNKSYEKIIKNELTSATVSKALLDVYFNKADFCIIEKDLYADMLLFNPSLEKNLTIVEKSPEIFFSALESIHKDASPELQNLFNEMFDNKKFENDFREFFKLINLDSLSRIKFEDLKGMENFYDEYENLKKKNK